MDFADTDKQFQAMESDSKVRVARAAKQTCTEITAEEGIAKIWDITKKRITDEGKLERIEVILQKVEYKCANLDEHWLCSICGASWFGTLTDRGCPNCGAGTDRIDVRNDLVDDIQGRKV